MTIRVPTGTPKTHEAKLSRAEFIGLIDHDKWNTIRTSTNNKVKQWVDQIRTMQIVDVKDPIVIDGITALETANVLTSGEAATILQGKPV